MCILWLFITGMIVLKKKKVKKSRLIHFHFFVLGLNTITFPFHSIFFHIPLLNECPSHIQMCPTVVMKTPGFPLGCGDILLSALLLTTPSVVQSLLNSCFLCINANYCLDITDSNLIVFFSLLSAFLN